MIHYRIEVEDAHAHLFRATLSVTDPAPEQRLSLPVWIPGSYLVREFARHVSALTATQHGRGIPLEQLDKATWLAHCEGDGALVVTCLVYAFDASVRAAWLDIERGFFNGTGLCLRVEGREQEPHRLELAGLPAGWRIATALPLTADAAAGDGAPPSAVVVDPGAVTCFAAANYDELVDSPFELGRFWHGAFVAGGVPHEFVVAGAWPDFDGERLLADAKRICDAEIAFWHGSAAPPFERYRFLLNAVDDGHGGLEHRASTALVAPRRDLPQRGRADASDGHVGVLGLIAHEYFHAWNVKRLRPAEFTTLDYTQENYTELLWFFEGFTSYYDDLFLLRAGLIDAPRYLKLVARTATGVLAAPGRHVQSVAQASFDAWIKYYRSDENTPNATISYYAKGALVALALDLTLRAEGRGTLDDAMRALWQRGTVNVAPGGARPEGDAGAPISEADIDVALHQVGGRSYAPELASWVHGTGDLPLPALLANAGVAWQHSPASAAQRLGVRVSESALTGVKVTHVQRGGAAERAGLASGDEILAVQGWRLRRLEEALRVAEPGVPAVCLVARDQRVMALTLTIPPDAAAFGAVSLQLDPKPAAAALARRQAWLGA